jgi:hypothetical protein
MKVALITLSFTLVTGCNIHRDKDVLLYPHGVGAADEFTSSFARVPECHGIRVHVVSDGHNPVTDVRIHYYSGTSPAPFGFVAMPHGSPNFGGDTVDQAVKQACELVKGKGGEIAK